MPFNKQSKESAFSACLKYERFFSWDKFERSIYYSIVLFALLLGLFIFCPVAEYFVAAVRNKSIVDILLKSNALLLAVISAIFSFIETKHSHWSNTT